MKMRQKKWLHKAIPILCVGALALQSTNELQAQNNQIPLQGTYNFRDLGGYKTQDHQQIKKNKIYRSATLAWLYPEDTLTLKTLHIAKDIDFRGPKEIAYGPDKIPANIQHITCGAGCNGDGPDDWAAMAAGMKRYTVAEDDQGAEAYYRKVDSFGVRYAPLFQTLLTLPTDSAIVMHCVGGKDRTGIAAALLEYVLGVDMHQIVADYELTNQYRENYNEQIVNILVTKYGVDRKRAEAYGIAKGKFILATFDALKQKYGSIDNFVKEGLQLDQKDILQLRQMYLEPTF